MRRGQSGVMGTNDGLELWIVNQYAQRDGQPGITRHSTLARLMSDHAVRTTIFAADGHYWSPGRQRVIPQPSAPGSATHVVVPAPAAQSNGAKRVVSMAVFSAMAIVRGWRVRSSGRPDIVLGSSPHPFGAVAAWILAKRHRARFVLEIRDIWPKSLVMMLGTPRWHPFIVVLSLMERFLYARADAVVTLLPGSERHIRDVCPSVREIHWIPNGVDAASTPSHGPAPDRSGFVAMYAGAHGVPNSLHTFLGAAKIVRDREQAQPTPDEPMKFVLVGDGKEKGRLQLLAQELCLSNVTFKEPVPKAEIMGVLATADVLVLTLMDSPVFRDGISPNKLFDYMAAERPVVMAVDTPVNPVIEAKAGMTVPPADPEALAAALISIRGLDPVERAAMGRRGREYVSLNHDMGVLAAKLATLLHGVASSHS